MKWRSDAWTHAEDSLLLDTVLDYIRHGVARLRAFEDVGEKIGRTPGAVAFRYNSSVFPKHRKEINRVNRERIHKRYYSGKAIIDLPLSETDKKDLLVLCHAVLEENERLKNHVKNYERLSKLLKEFEYKGSKQS